MDNGLCIAQAYTAALNCSADAMEEIDAMTDPDDEGMTLAEVMAIFCRYI